MIMHAKAACEQHTVHDMTQRSYSVKPCLGAVYTGRITSSCIGKHDSWQMAVVI